MDIICYMKSFMTLIPAAGPVPAWPQSPPLLIARSSQESQARCKDKPVNTPAGNWLYMEDEYFPFDADGFEER